jgi:hypothetical protein
MHSRSWLVVFLILKTLFSIGFYLNNDVNIHNPNSALHMKTKTTQNMGKQRLYQNQEINIHLPSKQQSFILKSVNSISLILRVTHATLLCFEPTLLKGLQCS